MSQKITQTVKKSCFFNDFKRRKTMSLSCRKKKSALLRQMTSKSNGDFIV